MKRTLSISMLSVAMLLMMALSLASHSSARFFCCAADVSIGVSHSCNDHATGFPVAGTCEGISDGCLIHASYTQSDLQTSVAAPVMLDLFTLPSLVLNEPEQPSRSFEFSRYLVGYQSVFIRSCDGLRAPPLA